MRTSALPIEMSGLPVFDRDRQFAGFRGFGICRDVDRLAALEQRRGAGRSRRRPKSSRKSRRPMCCRFPPPPPPNRAAPALSPGEHSAFQELARELSDRLKKTLRQERRQRQRRTISAAEPRRAPPRRSAAPPRAARNGDAARDTQEGRPILDRLPVGILVYRLNNLIYANRAFLDWTGYPTLEALTEAGGLDSLFIETKAEPPRRRRPRTAARR